ncbi:19374_t:CDS:2 [Dentiscutata erythropus]|uniref:19374_t:CDS:1 n=1 Tax=Dentiscutata erythropus TaxID=1348616 RepID=A0A9N9F8F3_9GLOM|nr:19374_t:CDS:2 [Dentiscutata erythropus]
MHVHKSSLSIKIKNLLEPRGFKVKPLYSTEQYSTIEVSFEGFLRNLIIWNKEISNSNDYLELYQIASKFRKETKKSLKNNMSYLSEYEILDDLKEEYFDFYANAKNIKDDIKLIFVPYMTTSTLGLKKSIIEYNYILFTQRLKKCLENFTQN